MFVLCEEAKRIDVVGLFGFSPPCIPGSLHYGSGYPSNPSTMATRYNSEEVGGGGETYFMNY